MEFELYDLEHDAWETNNLARNSRYESVFAELRRALETWSRETSDFPPSLRQRDDIVDRLTGEWLDPQKKVPPLRSASDM